MFQLPWEILVSVVEALPFQTLGILEMTTVSWQFIEGWSLVCELWRARAAEHLGGESFLQMVIQKLRNTSGSAWCLFIGKRQPRMWRLVLPELWKRCLHFGKQVITNEVKRFWADHEVKGGDVCTHYAPWLRPEVRGMLSREGPGRWFFPEDDQTQNFLFMSIAWMHSRGIPAYIVETPKPVMPLIETLDVITDDDFMPFIQPPWILAGQNSGPGEFLKSRAVLLRASHPGCHGWQHLDVCVYGARCYRLNHKWRSSIRFVWPSISVDSNAAQSIRQRAIEIFDINSEEDPVGFLGSLRRDYLNFGKPGTWSPQWSTAFQPVPHEDAGIRMAYTPYTNCVRTEAPYEAIGKARFHFQVSTSFDRDGLTVDHVECNCMVWMETSHDRSVADWISSASCRSKLANTMFLASLSRTRISS